MDINLSKYHIRETMVGRLWIHLTVSDKLAFCAILCFVSIAESESSVKNGKYLDWIAYRLIIIDQFCYMYITCNEDTVIIILFNH